MLLFLSLLLFFCGLAIAKNFTVTKYYFIIENYVDVLFSAQLQNNNKKKHNKYTLKILAANSYYLGFGVKEIFIRFHGKLPEIAIKPGTLSQ